jgi:hypothetical protein
MVKVKNRPPFEASIDFKCNLAYYVGRIGDTHASNNLKITRGISLC